MLWYQHHNGWEHFHCCQISKLCSTPRPPCHSTPWARTTPQRCGASNNLHHLAHNRTALALNMLFNNGWTLPRSGMKSVALLTMVLSEPNTNITLLASALKQSPILPTLKHILEYSSTVPSPLHEPQTTKPLFNVYTKVVIAKLM